MATEDKDDGSSVSFRLHDFLGYTTVHGAGRIVASHHWIRKICWVILILVTLGVLTSQIENLYQMYQKRPLATRVAIQHDTSLNFPAITICDMNALRKEELKNYLPESLRIKLEANTEDDDEEEEEEEDATAAAAAAAKAADEEEKEEEEEEKEGDPSTLEKDYIDREYLRAKISEQKIENLMSLGHQFDDLVVYCTFKGVFCANYSNSFWNRFWHYAYGNCYVFNGGKKESGMDAEILKSNQPGPLHEKSSILIESKIIGLSLELNIDQEQYVGAISQEAGVRIDISDQGEMPFPFEKGLSLAPGYATSIGLRKVVIKRQDPLSRNRCMKNASMDDANIYKELMQVNYSSTACKGSCLAYSQQKACGCIHYRFAMPPATNQVCDVLNKTVARCIHEVQKNFIEDKLKCSDSCPPPCSESTYKLATSYSKWPTKSYEQIYKVALKKRSKEVDGSDNFRANVLKLDIFFEELNFEVISEERSYELPNFMSDLGGSLGLWIGMSVLSFAEILELMLLTCYSLGKKFKRRIMSGKVTAFEE